MLMRQNVNNDVILKSAPIAVSFIGGECHKEFNQEYYMYICVYNNITDMYLSY